jgi:hypothetical protein
VAITLGSIILPATLVWEDELTWTPIVQSVTPSLTGAPIIQIGVWQAGRPITLVGKSDGNAHTGAILRSALLTLKTALEVAGATWTLTLHDGRTFSVCAAENPLDVEPLPVLRSFAAANPASNRWYLIRALRLLTV